jgi:alcohol dehydrogenase
MSNATMQAVVWEAPEILRQVVLPKPQLCAPGDAVVRVEAASTCGTDLHIYRGAIPGYLPGTVIGHEFMGVVESVGPAVTRFKIGQRVRGNDFAACGQCAQCVAGRHTQCHQRMLFGFSGIQPKLDGTLAEYVRVPWADTVLDPLPEGIDMRAALLASDVLPTALDALNCCQPFVKRRLAIIGAGPVGLLIALLAAARGWCPVLVENNPYRATHARAAGIEMLDLPAGAPLADAHPELMGSANAVIDAVGGERGLAAALAVVSYGGCIVGVGSQAGSYAVDWGHIFQRELSLHFVIGNGLRMRSTLNAAMLECAPYLDFIFSDQISLCNVPAYFSRLQKRETFKAVVYIGGGDICA